MINTIYSLDRYYEILHLLYVVFTSNDETIRYSHKLELCKLIAKL